MMSSRQSIDWESDRYPSFYTARGALEIVNQNCHQWKKTVTTYVKLRHVQLLCRKSYCVLHPVSRNVKSSRSDNRRDISKFKLEVALILKTPRTFFTHVGVSPWCICLRGVFFKTPRKNTPDFKVYGLLFSHFITWVKKFKVFSNFLARNSNFQYLQVYYHVIQLPPEATIYWLTFLLLSFANFSIDIERCPTLRLLSSGPSREYSMAISN